MYIKITPNESVEIKEIPAGADMLRLMQSEVGGNIETLGAGYLDSFLSVIVPGIIMIVNEEDEIKELDYNLEATECLADGLDYIVGDALFFKRGENEYGEQDIVGLTAEEADSLYKWLTM
ncbi:MAG: DUF3846 domain-containing protein [Clostridia bacterium]|nr:DUF3846 domain-containing protein [Clostridia bacterium]